MSTLLHRVFERQIIWAVTLDYFVMPMNYPVMGLSSIRARTRCDALVQRAHFKRARRTLLLSLLIARKWRRGGNTGKALRSLASSRDFGGWCQRVMMVILKMDYNIKLYCAPWVRDE